jgi:hypothetical protein
MTTESDAVALAAAGRIVESVGRFPPWMRQQLALFLANDTSETLEAVGLSLIEDEPVAALARALQAEVFLGDAQVIAAQLSDAEPWATIRGALEDVIAAWRGAHPGYRTVYDRGHLVPRKRRPRPRSNVPAPRAG